MTQARRVAALATASVLAFGACGAAEDDTSSEANDLRTVRLEMVDIAFEPATLRIARGETVRLRFTNTGKLSHDAFIGTPDEQSDHEDEMRDTDNAAAHGHEDDAEDAIVVEPGKTGELVYTFDGDTAIEIGCHQPGHYAAGMKIAVDVT